MGFASALTFPAAGAGRLHAKDHPDNRSGNFLEDGIKDRDLGLIEPGRLAILDSPGLQGGCGCTGRDQGTGGRRRVVEREVAVGYGALFGV